MSTDLTNAVLSGFIVGQIRLVSKAREIHALYQWNVKIAVKQRNKPIFAVEERCWQNSSSRSSWNTAGFHSCK